MFARREHDHGSRLHAHHTIRACVQFGGEVHRGVRVAHGTSACDVRRGARTTASARTARRAHVCRALVGLGGGTEWYVAVSVLQHLVKKRFQRASSCLTRTLQLTMSHLTTCSTPMGDRRMRPRVPASPHATLHGVFARTFSYPYSNGTWIPCAGAFPPRVRECPRESVARPCRTRRCQRVSWVCRGSETDSSSRGRGRRCTFPAQWSP